MAHRYLIRLFEAKPVICSMLARGEIVILSCANRVEQTQTEARRAAIQ